MRLLLDGCLPKRLKRAFLGFDISTVPEMGWAGAKAGIEHQQNLSVVPVRIVSSRAISNRLEDTEPLIPKILEVLDSLAFGVHVF